MHILVAPDSFKGSLTASQAAAAIAAGIAQVGPSHVVKQLPIADGGEGTLDALLAGAGGQGLSVTVRGPLGDPVAAMLGLLSDQSTAVVEMAQASGLTLVPPELRNPLFTTSFGTGQLILAALDHGCRQLVVTIGGSATVDGGIGMLTALGARFLDADGIELPPIGQSLGSIASVDLCRFEPRLAHCSLRIACDVTNPLTGPLGAAPVFGPQKGATPTIVAQLAAGLERFAAVTAAATGRRVTDLPGAGAAGGVGAALMAYANGQMHSGVAVVLDTLQVDQYLPEIDLIITGEGRMDGQTAQGKAPTGIAARGRQHGCQTIALVGSLGPGYEAVYEQGISAVFPIINRPMSLEQAMQEASSLLTDCAVRVMRLHQLGMDINSSTVGRN